MVDLSNPLPAAKKRTFTPEMEAIFAHEPVAPLIVEAGAGSGKTSTLVEYAKRWKRLKGLYLAYNAAIAKEAKSRFPGHIHASTAHSYAFRALGVGRHSARLVGKLRKNDLFEAGIRFDDAPLADDKMYRAISKGVENFCNSAGSELTASHCGLDAYGRPTQDRVMQMIAPVIDRIIRFDESGLPFTHDVYLKNLEMHGKLGSDYDYIMVDEAQDLNPLLLSLVGRSGKPCIYVGDRKQSIYAFRGSIDALSQIDAKSLPLSQSWRFGQSVADVSNFLLEHTSFPPTWKLKGKPGHTTTISEYKGQAPAYSMVLSRTNSRLFEGLVNVKVPFHVIGGFEAIAIQLLSALALSRGAPRSQIKDPVVQGYRQWSDMVSDAKHGDDPEVRRIVKIIEDYGERITSIIDDLRKIHCPDMGSAKLVLSTAHKSKGLEAPTVVILDDFQTINDLRELKAARKLRQVDFDQEIHLKYVAGSRATDLLLLSGPLWSEIQHLVNP